MKIEITIPSRSAAIAAAVLRELLVKGDSFVIDDSHHIETVIRALDEADRIVIESDDFLSQEH